jgi:hypothetical protein
LCGKNVRSVEAEGGAEEGDDEGEWFDSTTVACECAVTAERLSSRLNTSAVFFKGIPHVSDVFRREIGLYRQVRICSILRRARSAGVKTAVQSVF